MHQDALHLGKVFVLPASNCAPVIGSQNFFVVHGPFLPKSRQLGTRKTMDPYSSLGEVGLGIGRNLDLVHGLGQVSLAKEQNVNEGRDLLAEKLNLGKDRLVITRHSCAFAIKSRQLKLQTEKSRSGRQALTYIVISSARSASSFA